MLNGFLDYFFLIIVALDSQFFRDEYTGCAGRADFHKLHVVA